MASVEHIRRARASVAPADGGEPVSAVPDASTCPLCGGPNDCVIGNPALDDTPCWCVGQRFPDELFAQIPAQDLGRRCVCARCALRSKAP